MEIRFQGRRGIRAERTVGFVVAIRTEQRPAGEGADRPAGLPRAARAGEGGRGAGAHEGAPALHARPEARGLLQGARRPRRRQGPSQRTPRRLRSATRTVQGDTNFQLLYYQSKRHCPVSVVEQGGGQCIFLQGGVFQRGQNRTIPFGLIVQAIVRKANVS